MAADDRPRPGVLIVAGMHRSGTTFAGQILGSLPGATYLHEPFNPRYGLRDVPAEYPYPLYGSEEDDPLFGLLRDVVNLRGRFRTRHPKDNLTTAIARRVVAGEAGLTQWRARIDRTLRRTSTLVIKDPYLTLALPRLIEGVPGVGVIRAICLVRHPVALWRSMQRMDWGIRFSEVGGPGLEDRLSEEGAPSPAELDLLPDVEKTGHLWSLLYRDIVATQNESLLLTRHEDMSTHPMESFSSMASHEELTLDDPARLRIERQTTGTVIGPEEGKLHQFERDSKAVAWSWTQRPPDEDEMALRRITGDIVENVYGAWRPQTDGQG